MSSHKKRVGEAFGSGSKRHSNYASEEKTEELVFEDPFGDDLEDEDMVESNSDEEVVDGEREEGKEDVDMDDGEDTGAAPIKKVFMPGVDKLEDDEVLDYDASAYDMYYAMTAEWPSLSIDVVRDNLGAVRTQVSILRPLVVKEFGGT